MPIANRVAWASAIEASAVRGMARRLSARPCEAARGRRPRYRGVVRTFDLIATAVCLALVVGAFAFVRWLQRRRPSAERLGDVPPVKIAAATAGSVVRIIGRVEARSELVEAPISKRPCVAWEIDIRDRGDLSGAPLLSKNVQRPFALRDGTGVAHVERAQLFLVLDHEGERVSRELEGASLTGPLLSGAEPCPVEIERVLRAAGLSTVAQTPLGPAARSLVWREGVLSVGELASAVGRARWRATPDQDDYRNAKQELILEPEGEVPVKVTDDRAVALKGYGKG